VRSQGLFLVCCWCFLTNVHTVPSCLYSASTVFYFIFWFPLLSMRAILLYVRHNLCVYSNPLPTWLHSRWGCMSTMQLCIYILCWCSVFCDCILHLHSVFVSCICILCFPLVSASCVCVLCFPTVSCITQLLCSLHDFFRCLLHRFLCTAVSFILTCCTLSLASHSFIALTQHCISPLSLLSTLYWLADLTAHSPQIAPCLTWVLPSLELVLLLFHPGVHHYWSPL